MPTLRIATWNVENLFRPGTSDIEVEPEAYRRKLDLLAGVALSLRLDVLALQEVGGAGPLSDLQSVLGRDYPHARLGIADGRGIACAVLSRLPFLATSDLPAAPLLPALPAPGGRPALEVRVALDGLLLDVITAHWKSKLLTFQRPNGNPAFSTRDEDERARAGGDAILRRTAEAVTMRRRVNRLLPVAPGERRGVIVLGDLNDLPDAATSLIPLGPPGSAIGTLGFAGPTRATRRDCGTWHR